MARTRLIKPSIWKNELLGTRDPLLTLLFIGLWGLADREGRLEDRPLRIKAEVFPYREMELSLFNGYLTELVALGFIRRYEVGENKVIEVLKFTKHQSPHSTEKPSDLPSYPVENTEVANVTVIAPLNNGEVTVRERSLTLNTVTLNKNQKHTKRNAPIGADVCAVFDEWKRVLNHPAAKLDIKRRRRIEARLADGFTADDLKRAIAAVARDPFYIGDNDRGRKFDGIETIFRDRAQVEKFLEAARAETVSPEDAKRAEIERRLPAGVTYEAWLRLQTHNAAVQASYSPSARAADNAAGN